MAYTTIDDPTAFFQTVTYTGNGSSNAITGVGFQPDFNWLKNRSNTGEHLLVDAIRGMKNLRSNSNVAESSNSSIHQQSLDSDGFTVAGTGANSNTNGHTFVSWNWKTGTAFSNDASSTSVGSIDSAGSVNTTAGFSIISYTGTGSAGTIAHGLGVKPSFILFKNRERAVNWLVYDKKNGANKFLYLNVTDAIGDDSGHFNDTEPTTSVFSVGGADGTNYSGENLIAYCFAEKQGYSKFGVYTGNNVVDGAFVYTGFKPAFVMVKLIDTQTDGWVIQDNKRDISNTGTSTRLRANTSAADFDGSNEIDFLSNGFKCRGDDGEINGNGSKHIYMAFAENPFVTSKGVPTTAR
jgi:hypothetical protein